MDQKKIIDENSLPQTSVILPVHNGQDTISQQIEQILLQGSDLSWELLVVDNASTDDTALIVAAYEHANPERVRVIQAPDMKNLSYARNRGVHEAKGSSVIFADADDLVGKQWLLPLQRALTQHQLVAPQMEYTRLNSERTRFLQGAFQHERIEFLFSYPVVNGVCGWNKELWISLGGNDESIQGAGEDFDMAIRAYREKDVSPVFISDSIYHVKRRNGFVATFKQAKRNSIALVSLQQKYAIQKSSHQLFKKSFWALRHVWYLFFIKYQIGWAHYVGSLYGQGIARFTAKLNTKK